ncbi:MAG: hypothetical protein IKM34_03925, partial [Clostridia bacterium]|nr:hypothetical protein [Clostridia bacterium]
YWKNGNGKGNHHDFYGNDRYINIFCDICRCNKTTFSEYDLEAVAEMIKKGYIIKENDKYLTSVVTYTVEQHKTILRVMEDFISTELASIIKEMDKTAAQILGSHTPKHLQDQVKGIASMDRFGNAVCIPATILVERQFLSTAWHPLEIPTTYVVLNE